jgi:peptide-methionine (S)-S-oxide reductase
MADKSLFPTKNNKGQKQVSLACFAAGCFWGVEEEFRKLKGVISTAVGYTAGHTENPTYRDVCGKETGHAEAVLMEYDPITVTYNELLDLFWHLHDPTTLNRQGPDVGDQYRSAIYYFDEEQKKLALETRDKTQKEVKRPVVTQIVPAEKFYYAEAYHQQYVEKGGVASCHFR